MVAALENPRTGWAARAERSLLRELEGGCAVPIGAWTTVTKGGVDAGMLSSRASICCLTDLIWEQEVHLHPETSGRLRCKRFSPHQMENNTLL